MIQEGRQAHREELNHIASDWIGRHTAAECIKLLGAQVPTAIIYNVEDIMRDEQFLARDDIVEIDTEIFGPLKMQNVTPKLSETPGKIKWAGKPLGTFNHEVLSELGYTEEEIQELEVRKII